MKSRAAVLWEIGKEWDVVDMDIDGPGPGEVLLKTKVAGMCHSDEHVVTGDMLMPHYPCIGGHEGAGEVLEVGPASPRWRPATTCRCRSSPAADAASGASAGGRTCATSAPTSSTSG